MALWAGGGAIAGLTVYYALPVLLASPDTALDFASLTYNVYTGNYAAARWDAISLMLPGVTGLGALNRAGDTLQTVNRLDNFYDAGRYSDNVFRSLPASCNSFSADTEVSTKDGDTPINLIEIGDYVLAWDESTDTLGWYEVTDTIHHTDEVVTEVIIDGEWIETTPEHPFYVEDKGWVNAEDLRTGDEVRQADGTTGTVWLRWNVETSQEMYNLTVDEAHTFFVGDGQWLVHNAGCDFGNLNPYKPSIAGSFDSIAAQRLRTQGLSNETIASRLAFEPLWNNSHINQLSELSSAYSCSFAICGGYAETSRGLYNRYMGINQAKGIVRSPIGPFSNHYYWRNTGLPTGLKDLDYWTPSGIQPFGLKEDIARIFYGSNVNVNNITYDNYFFPPSRRINQPRGSILFTPRGDVSRIVSLWQRPFSWP
jgi:hypothetical protein